MKSSLFVQNLKCGGCANTILRSLGKINDVDEVAVEVETGEVQFEHIIPETQTLVAKELKRLGYPIKSEQNGFKSVARSFVSCGIGRISK